MTTPRDFLNLIVLDHQFELRVTPSPDNFQGTAYIANLTCSCNWSTGRAIHEREARDGYDRVLTQEWAVREQLQHLLDQELDTRSVLLKTADGLK